MPITGEAASYFAPLSELLKEKGIERPTSVVLDVDKSDRLMKLIVDGQDVKTYLFGLGGNPDKPKTRRGDSATPEGEYYVCQKLPNSRFYLSLKLAYPNATDAERGVSRGLIDSRTCEKIKSAVESRRVPPMNTRLGGDICIHGGGAGKIDWSGGAPTMKVRDWTAGCIALENRQMKELFEFIPVGTVVRITA